MTKPYPTVKTADGVEVEITHSDANREPGLKGGQLVNLTVVWFRPENHNWIRSKHRSAITTADLISRTNLADLNVVSDTNNPPEKTDEQAPKSKPGGGTSLTRSGPRK